VIFAAVLTLQGQHRLVGQTSDQLGMQRRYAA